MNDINDFLKGVITECTIVANQGRIVFNGIKFYLDAPRLGKKIDISDEDINALVDGGYATRLFNGAIRLNSKKMDEIYYDLFRVEKIPHPKHERMTIDRSIFIYQLH